LTPGLTVVNGVADTDKIPADKLTAAIRTFANRALRGRRLAYALIAEPVDPAAAAACIVGAFMEALIGPLAPAKGTGPRADRHLIEQIARFCLRASVGTPEAKS
jgi:hypothetical protein